MGGRGATARTNERGIRAEDRLQMREQVAWMKSKGVKTVYYTDSAGKEHVIQTGLEKGGKTKVAYNAKIADYSNKYSLEELQKKRKQQQDIIDDVHFMSSRTEHSRLGGVLQRSEKASHERSILDHVIRRKNGAFEKRMRRYGI